MIKQVHNAVQPPFLGALKAALGAFTVLLPLAPWLPGEVARAQGQPGLTFEIPAVCQAELGQAVPEPGAPPAELPAALAQNVNPLWVPTQPAEVELEFDQPISLEQAVELAYRSNPDLEAARLAVERSQAALAETEASLYPRVDLNAGLDALTNAIQGQGSGDAGSSAAAALTANGRATYDVLTGGERSARIRAAELQLRQQSLALEQAQAELRSQTNLAYYDVQSTRERIRIDRAFLAEACRNLRDTILFFEAGVGTRFDVLRAEVQVAQARQDLVLARSAWVTAQRRLAALLNLPPDVTVVTTPVAIGGVWPLTLEESILLAFQNRAELESNLLQREVAQTQETIALATLRPQVQVSGSVNGALALNDISRADISGFDRNASAGFGVQLGANWRLFDGGAAVARAAQAQRDQAIAESNFALDRNQIQVAVEEAYFSLEANLANIDTARVSLEQAREALRLARRRFDAGVGNQLEVLEAQRELTTAQVQLLESILGYNRSLTSLERAVSNLAQ